jgi:GT2 family glycosyltransferase
MSAPDLGMADTASTSDPSVAVVVLNWNGVADTLACLTSLRGSRERVCAIVVDNGSSGSDAEKIRLSGLADTVLETGRNLGYAGGNNVGLRHALDDTRGFEFVAVLNNDTVVDPDCFGVLVEQLRGEAAPLALSPTVRYFDDPTRPWFAGGVIDQGWPRHLQQSETCASDKPYRLSEWLSGCCITARALTWRRVGLFDASYFLIFEDCDWSARARKKGVTLAVSNDSTILHRVSRSLSSGPSSLLGSFYFIRNGLRFESRYARRYIPHFLDRHLLRPTMSDLIRLTPRPGLGFRWLGALAFLVGQRGPAPRACLALAQQRVQLPARERSAASSSNP